MSMKRTAFAVGVAASLLTTSCSAKAQRDEPQVGPVQYGVGYTLSADQYDEKTRQPPFDDCAGLPGASFAGSEDSLPPGLSIRFKGTKAQQRDLEACLRALPDTRLTGPFEVPTGS